MKRIIGIWDQIRSGGVLGTLLMLLEELQIQRQIHGASAIDIIAVGDVEKMIEGIPIESEGLLHKLCLDGIQKVTPLIAVLRSMAGVDTFYKCPRSIEYQDLIGEFGADSILWPNLDALINNTHNYDSTLVTQKYFEQQGNIPHISMKDELLAWGKNYLQTKCGENLSVAVHLKNNSSKPGQSIANMEAWQKFFANCQTKHPVHFVLIGDDPVSEQVRRMPNITMAQDDGLTLDCHLALIQAAELFMGMMSGPANMAIFGEQPYLIFKNPNHHAKEMIEELGDSDHYLFAKPNQIVLRKWDTTETLIGSFDNMIVKMDS